MRMFVSRNLTSHTYDEQTAEEIIEAIREKYFHLFEKLREKFEAVRKNEERNEGK